MHKLLDTGTVGLRGHALGAFDVHRVKSLRATFGVETDRIHHRVHVRHRIRHRLSVPDIGPNGLEERIDDMLKRVGVNMDYQATDWGMVVQRRALTKPPAEGGWNLFCTGFSGLDFFTPASHLPLRGNGKGAWFGWPDDPKIEALREAWFNTLDQSGQKKIGAEIQLQAFENVPYTSRLIR